MDANIEGRWPKGKEAGIKRAERVGCLLAVVCDLVGVLAVIPSSCPVGGVPGKSQCQAVSSEPAMLGLACKS